MQCRAATGGDCDLLFVHYAKSFFRAAGSGAKIPPQQFQRGAFPVNFALRPKPTVAKDGHWRAPSLQRVLEQEPGYDGWKKQELPVNGYGQTQPY